jgi:hypothetical protein
MTMAPVSSTPKQPKRGSASTLQTPECFRNAIPSCKSLGGTGSNSVGVTNKICKLQPLTVADGTRPSEHQAGSGLARPDLRVCADLPARRRCYARVSQSNRGSPLGVGARGHATDIRAKLTVFALTGMVVGLVSGVA